MTQAQPRNGVRPRMITLDPDVDDALRAAAKSGARPMARLVNEALRAMLDLPPRS